MTSRYEAIRRRAPIAVLLPVIAALTGCGGGASASPSAPSSPGGGGSTVNVTLQEWAVVPAQPTAPAGTVTFNVTNNGPEDPHELVVFRTDLGHRALPTREDGGVDEEGEGVELIGEIEEFDPGATESADFELAAGKYVLICNLVEEEEGELESHYGLGMSVEFTVQ
jgi:uncharacterized cupredoxin-like copper-binding protein